MIDSSWVTPNHVFKEADVTLEENYATQTIHKDIIIEKPYVHATAHAPYAEKEEIQDYDIFSKVSTDILDKLQNKSIVFIFNFCHEGSHEFFPFAEALHKSALSHNIPFTQIYYLSGDSKERDIYQNKFKQGIRIYTLSNYSTLVQHGADRHSYVPNRKLDIQEHTDKYFTFLSRKPRYWRSCMVKNIMQEHTLKQYAILSHATEDKPYSKIQDIPYNLDYNDNPVQKFFETNGFSVFPGTNTGSDPLSPLDDIYSQVLFDVVGETFQDGMHEFFSEKTFKPMYNGMPLLIWGTQGMNKRLKKLGFKTYEKWFDLSFDDEPEPRKRLELLIKEISRVCSLLNTMTREQRIEWSLQYPNILDYNKKVIETSPFLSREINTMFTEINNA